MPADLTGQRFNRLLVLSEAARKDGGKSRAWLCRCDCSKEVEVRQRNLTCGKAQSCGCLARERAAVRIRRVIDGNVTHGMSRDGSPEYAAWHHMRQRCLDPGYRTYPDYGGRGITICERWNSFVVFLEDMGPRPSSAHSLDRIDVNSNYEPANCRWADHKTQQRNRRSNRLIEFNGETKPLSAWAEQYGIPMVRVHQRIVIYKWSVEEALTTPVTPPRKGMAKAARRQTDPAHLEKQNARNAVNYAVGRGKMTKPLHCQHSGCESTYRVHAHHHRGYAKENRLDVVWLCQTHHEEAEKQAA